MNSFVNGISTQRARTENGMKALSTAGNACVELFFKIGALRGNKHARTAPIIPLFLAAYAEDKEKALRIALWARDVRGGAGERKVFRDILVELEKTDPESAILLTNKIPELGRWDDMLVFKRKGAVKDHAFNIIKTTLNEGISASKSLQFGKNIQEADRPATDAIGRKI